MRLKSVLLTQDFNPRSPHGERRGDDRALRTAPRISIHAPRTGSDQKSDGTHGRFFDDFNPRSPHGERHARFCLQSR